MQNPKRIKVYLFHCFIFLKSIFIFNVDVKMSSPPNSPPNLYGSSRMTGGVLRGHALGNVSNAADFPDVPNVLQPIPGKVFIYTSNQNPANLTIQDMKPSIFIKHNVTPLIQPVLSKVADKFSPIQSK